MIQIAQPYFGDEEFEALREPLATGWVTQGPKVKAFERAFAERHGVKHAIATTSCTTALHLIMVALGIGENDEVIVPAFTWIATANVVVYCGARPIFVDVDPASFNIDPDLVAANVTARTKAIVPVHLFGLCADMNAIADAAPGIPLVEDAACAAGAAYRGASAGSLGTAAAFSFHPRKTITTGEGGMVTTNDDELAARLDCLRNHGAGISEEQRAQGPAPYRLPDFDVVGFNYRMTDLQGALGLVQLGRLDALVREREEWAAFYSRELAQVAWLRTPVVPEEYKHGWQSYVCFVDETISPLSRNALMEQLHSRGVSTRPGTHTVPTLGYYSRRYGVAPEDFPGARDCHDKSIALPLHNQMSAEDYEYVVSSILEAA